MAKKSEQQEEKKAEERRDAGITRMLNTPPKPFTKKKENPDRQTGGQKLGSGRPMKSKIKSGD